MGPLVTALIVAALCAAFLLPAIIAALRGHASAWGIFALNLLLGWSGIFWIIALIWALSNKGQANQQTVIVNNHHAEAQQSAQPIYIPVPQPVPMQPLMSAPQEAPVLEGGTRTCPSCAETIKAAAIKCRFCGRKISPKLITHNPEY